MNQDIYEIVRLNIRTFRKYRGLTQAQLSEKIGLTHDYYRQIESQSMKRGITLDVLYRISKTLEIEPGLFFKTAPDLNKIDK